MIVGGYTLDLYCDSEKCPVGFKAGRWSFTGPTKARCMREARKGGWKIRLGKAICPKCAVARHPKETK